MKQIKIEGKHLLEGTIKISGAKNSAVALIPASLLSDGIVTIDNVPNISDIDALSEILEFLGVKVERNEGLIKIDSTNLINKEIPEMISSKLRASYYFMSALLGKYKKVEMYFPGGCSIGARPIDQTLKGFKELGATVKEEENKYTITAENLHGGHVYLDMPSVGATINTMLVAVRANGKTIIENAAKEPEIVNVATILNNMGAKITGAGFGRITIEGVESLKKPEPFTPIFDRIEAGTFMVAAAITNSKITINGVNEQHLMPNIEKLKECGVNCIVEGNRMIVDGTGEKRPVDIKTMPYPGFPTDMQPQMMVLLSMTPGVSVITETVFENRFMHVGELGRMGANIKIDGKVAIVEGVSQLTGCNVKATDLRAGAAMILAGLVANGQTEIGEVYHIDRGYTNIEEKFVKLGADIERVTIQ